MGREPEWDLDMLEETRESDDVRDRELAAADRMDDAAMLALTAETRHAALVAYAAQCRADASAEDDPDEALGLLQEARAAEARAIAIAEGRA